MMKRITAITLMLAMVMSCFVFTNVLAAKQVYGVDNLNKERGDLYIGFLGGSITLGTGASQVKNRYSSLVTDEYFAEKFSYKNVTEINGAVGGTGSLYGLTRMKNDLKLGSEQSPDVVFVEYAVNDAGKPDRPNLIKNMESIVRQLISQPKVPAIIFLYTFSSDSVYCEGTENRSVENAIAEFHKVAQHYGIYEINLTEYIGKGIESGKWVWNAPGATNNLSGDSAHPTDYGYQIYAEYIKECLEKDYDKAFKKINPQTKPYSDDLYGIMEEVYFGDDKVLKSPEWVHSDRNPGSNNLLHNGYFENSNSLDATFEMEFTGTGAGINMLRNYNNAYLNWSIVRKSDGEIVAQATSKPVYPGQTDGGTGWTFECGLPMDTYILKGTLSEGEDSIKNNKGTGTYFAIGNLVVEKGLHENLPGPAKENKPTETNPGDATNNEIVSQESVALKDVADKSIFLKLDCRYSIAGGLKYKIDEDNHRVKPTLVNSRTLVPVRFIAERLGAEVSYDDTTSTVTIKLNGKTINMVINETKYTVDGNEYTLDVPAQLISERTMVPVRVVSEAFGMSVYWDEANSIIVITSTPVKIETSEDKGLLDEINVRIKRFMA